MCADSCSNHTGVAVCADNCVIIQVWQYVLIAAVII